MFRHAAVALLLMSASLAHAGADDARAWVQRMNEAVVQRNYDGVFTLKFGTSSEVFRIVHRYKNREMIERVISTDGSGYEQKRKGERWWEFHPNKRTVVTATRNRSFGFIPTLNRIDQNVARLYDVQSAGRTRLDGRDVQLVQFLPKDSLRYGYRLWLDPDSALPLKFQRVASDGKVMKEIAFINSPRMPDDIADEELMVELDFKGFVRLDKDRFTPMHNPRVKRVFVPQAALLPAGYRSLIFNSAAQEANADGPRTRYIVSDGISWADVFIAPSTGKPRASRGFTAGPMASYEVHFDDAVVTVVGEMPQAAAQAIAEAVRPE